MTDFHRWWNWNETTEMERRMMTTMTTSTLSSIVSSTASKEKTMTSAFNNTTTESSTFSDTPLHHSSSPKNNLHHSTPSTESTSPPTHPLPPPSLLENVREFWTASLFCVSDYADPIFSYLLFPLHLCFSVLQLVFLVGVALLRLVDVSPPEGETLTWNLEVADKIVVGRLVIWSLLLAD